MVEELYQLQGKITKVIWTEDRKMYEIYEMSPRVFVETNLNRSLPSHLRIDMTV